MKYSGISVSMPLGEDRGGWANGGIFRWSAQSLYRTYRDQSVAANGNRISGPPPWPARIDELVCPAWGYPFNHLGIL